VTRGWGAPYCANVEADAARMAREVTRRSDSGCFELKILMPALSFREHYVRAESGSGKPTGMGRINNFAHGRPRAVGALRHWLSIIHTLGVMYQSFGGEIFGEGWTVVTGSLAYFAAYV